MRAFDLSPLFSTTVGFDRMARMLEQMPSETAPTYPPYNIQKMGENAYRVTLAVAGFGDDEIAIEVKENLLTVTGKLAKENGANESYLHRGIATRTFERRFNLADHIQVTGCGARQGPASHRPGARASRGAEGAQDRHRDRRSEAAQPEGGLTGRGREAASRPRLRERGAGQTVRAPFAIGPPRVFARWPRFARAKLAAHSYHYVGQEKILSQKWSRPFLRATLRAEPAARPPGAPGPDVGGKDMEFRERLAPQCERCSGRGGGRRRSFGGGHDDPHGR